MLFTSKKDCQLTPVKKVECNRLVSLSEMERSNSGDITLVSSTEIAYHFSMLADPLKCYYSIQRLNKIAQRQRFSVIREYYDNIFYMISNANLISENIHQRVPNQPILPASEIINQCLTLIDKIASFQSFYLIIEEIKLKHITFLYELLPNELAFKTLGKLLVLNIEFAKHIIDLGIENIEEKITELNTPLFIWFLGSFAYFPDLNEFMIPFYEEYIINNSISQNETIRKFSYDALAILTTSSKEFCEWIESSEIITSIFKITPVSQACAKKYIELANVFLSNEITVFFKEGNGGDELLSVLIMCFDDDTGLAVPASKVLTLLVRLGYLSSLIDNRVDDMLFDFVSGSSSFKEKESAMKTLCFLFLNSDKQTQIRYLSLGITDVVSTSIEMGNNELHCLGIAVLQQMIHISNEENEYESLKSSISELLDMLSVEEYDQVAPPCQ